MGQETECWVWAGARSGYKSAYGVAPIWVGGRGYNIYVHRFSYEQHHGPIPPGMQVCHHCDNPPCFNPDHLFLGTAFDNMRDAAAKGRLHKQQRTHCIQGHPLAGDNLTPRAARGHRQCLTCDRESSRLQAQAIKQARLLIGMSDTEYRKVHGLSRRTAEAIIAKDFLQEM